MTTKNETVNQLIKEQHNVIRQYDRNEISENEYHQKYMSLKEKIDEETNKILSNHKLEDKPEVIEKDNSEEIKMAEEVKKPSNAQLILKALQMKSVKSIDDVASKIVDQNPDVNEARIKSQCKTMIAEIKAGKGKKSKIYKWDDEAFQLTAVEQ